MHRSICCRTLPTMVVLLLAFSTFSNEHAPAQETKSTTVPNLRELVARPQSEFASITRRYEADRGNLNRLHTIASSPTRMDRLERFNKGWLAALQAIDPTKLSEATRAEWESLRNKIHSELGQLGREAKIQAEISHWLPFAPSLIGLEEARRRMEPVDAPKTAGLLSDLKKQIEVAQREATADSKLTNSQAQSAGETASNLRTALKNWFNFYNNYDPLFTWWMAEPYKEVDQALLAYSTALRERANKAESVPSTQPKSVISIMRFSQMDSPDLRELLALPRSEMREVISKYQSERGGVSRFARAEIPLPTAPRSLERQMQLKQFYANWLAALARLDFDQLSFDAQMDYLLFENHLERELRRIGLQVQERARTAWLEELEKALHEYAALLGEKPAVRGARESGDIVGRPIGRAALESELAAEMIPYSAEELIALAHQEFAWCDKEIRKAARTMGYRDDWRQALEKVKTLHVEPGKQPFLIRDLAHEAITYLGQHDLVTVPPLAIETWRMEMMSPQRQLVNPFFTGGEVISVSYPTSTMSHEAKLQSMRGNNIHFSRATVHHELIPGHHLQQFMTARYKPYRNLFNTPFWTEGWALYWEFVLYDMDFPRSPEDRVGMLFWRMHRCARIIFSLSFHLGTMSPKQCIDFLVDRVGHERDNATAEVRRSFAGGYGPLYQAAYMLGGLQLRALRHELVDSGKMTNRAFHDAILKEGNIPIAAVRACLLRSKLTRASKLAWKFYGPNPGQKVLESETR